MAFKTRIVDMISDETPSLPKLGFTYYTTITDITSVEIKSQTP